MMRLKMLLMAMAVVSAMVGEAAMARVESSAYNGIAQRNLFGLHAPVVADTAAPAAPIALPKLTLTGITTIFGKREAFITLAATKPGQLPESFMLAEGQGFNEVEVTAIDERVGIVRVMNHGEWQVLDFDHDGVRPSNTPHDAMPQERILPRPEALPSGAGNEGSLTPEEQVALIEIQRVKFQRENNPIQTILPPTEMPAEITGSR
jgi:hypothetical protein